MLYKGRNRLFSNIFSVTFLKTIVMTATKFVIQSYIISIAIKSLMYKFVSKFQHFAPHTEDNQMFRELEEYYYRGLCLTDWEKPKNFCSFQDVLTFTEATLIIPLFMLVILYLPSILYICIISFKFYRGERWSREVLADPILFIFPLFTCISFYHKKTKITEEKENETHDTRINSEKDEEDTSESRNTQNQFPIEVEMKNEKSVAEDCNQLKEHNERSKEFSVQQSNVLYFLFFIGAAICIGGDISMQYLR